MAENAWGDAWGDTWGDAWGADGSAPPSTTDITFTTVQQGLVTTLTVTVEALV